MRLRILSLTIFIFLLSGCGKALESLVRVARPGADSGQPIQFEGKPGIKISPGATVSTSTDVALKAHVTITDRPMTGSDVAAKVTIGRQRNN